jgi:POT family proton-dependent oligopeptide transporter
MDLQRSAEGKRRHPPGLYVLFFTEMWERFSYYLMIGIFYQYLVDSQTGGMGWDGGKAAGVVGSYLGLVYFTPFLGGLIADRYLGYRVTVVLGAISMGIGHILLAFPTEAMLYAALAFLIIGNGLFKPNISTMVGRLYPPGSPLKDNAYTIFYMGINIGAFICNFVAAIVRNLYGWHWAFATAGFGMGIGLIVFVLFQKHIREADLSPAEKKEPRPSLMPLWFECLIPAAILGVLGGIVGSPIVGNPLKLGPATTALVFACIPVAFFYIRIWRGLADPTERGRVGALLAVFGVVIVFWMVFHQNSTALTEWAKTNTDRQPPSFMSSAIDLAPEFAEKAPPEYFYNADGATPRPADGSFRIVSDDEYKQLETGKQLSVADGKATPVTAAIHGKVFAGAVAGTPRLADGMQLKLVNTELFQSINPFFVMLFAPLMAAFWSFLSRRRKEPSTPAKIGFGLLLTGASALVMVGAVAAAGTPEGKVSALWLFGTYGVITVGELCLSPIGLSMVSKFSPRKITAFMMGGWFLSTAIGNKLSGVFGEIYHEWDHTNFFLMNAICAAVAGVAIFAMLPWLRRNLTETPESKPAEPQ